MTSDTVTGRFAGRMDQVAAAAGVLRGRRLEWRQLHGGLAHVTYAVTAEPGDRYVVKFLTQEMDDFGLMIPIEVLIANTAAAGESGVGARVVQALPEIPSVVLEYIDGRTLDTPDLAQPGYIPRIGRAIAGLHRDAPPMRNTMVIWKFLADYLGLVGQHSLTCPDGILDQLPVMRRIQAALEVNALDLVPSNNDLLARNIMDDGRIRIIDYDFSGMNDPMFDIGDLAMEGDYDPDQVAAACEAYFGAHDPVQFARARLFGIAAQYTWSLLFVGMGALLPEAPAEGFDYWQEASSRWDWTRAKLEDPALGSVIAAAGSA
ncbi:MAG TPA: phosphotransferase [Streptosporangiaceae bacterium]|jgi:thiamine kinase-like enzyme